MLSLYKKIRGEIAFGAKIPRYPLRGAQAGQQGKRNGAGACPSRTAGGPPLGPGAARMAPMGTFAPTWPLSRPPAGGVPQYFEDQPARHHVGLGEADLDLVAQGEDSPARAPDQPVAQLLVDVIVGGEERADRHQPVRPRLLQGNEEAEAGDARDPSGKAGPPLGDQ